MDAQAQQVIVAALQRGNTPGDAAALGSVTEAQFWREHVQGQADVEEGNIGTAAASFYTAAAQAEAQFADELVTRALGEDSTKEVLQVLQARNAARGRREDYERRKQQEETRHAGPPYSLPRWHAAWATLCCPPWQHPALLVRRSRTGRSATAWSNCGRPLPC
jgi:hypothetical protein